MRPFRVLFGTLFSSETSAVQLYVLFTLVSKSIGITELIPPPSKGHEGRIGMAAVVLKEGKEFDGTDTCRVVANYLPVYARPRFIRIQVSCVSNPVLQIA